jgi:hypothetical protein
MVKTYKDTPKGDMLYGDAGRFAKNADRVKEVKG